MRLIAVVCFAVAALAVNGVADAQGRGGGGGGGGLWWPGRRWRRLWRWRQWWLSRRRPATRAAEATTVAAGLTAEAATTAAAIAAAATTVAATKAANTAVGITAAATGAGTTRTGGGGGYYGASYWGGYWGPESVSIWARLHSGARGITRMPLRAMRAVLLRRVHSRAGGPRAGHHGLCRAATGHSARCEQLLVLLYKPGGLLPVRSNVHQGVGAGCPAIRTPATSRQLTCVLELHCFPSPRWCSSPAARPFPSGART